METAKTLPRSAPEAQGISSTAIAAFVKAAEGIHDLHSFMLLRHGVVVAEGWWHPYQANRRHMLFSLSKSFTSTAVGLAVSEGRLSVDDPLLKFFPQDAPRKISPNLAAMQVRHLLSMSTGHDQDTTDRMIRHRNPFKAFLALEVEHAPGTHFTYNSGATYMLAAIVQKLTGQTLIDYLTPRLFAPLGIAGAWWETHPNGVNFGGWGLNIKTEDIARFGQLYLQNGVWDGKQLIPAAWVQAATSQQVNNAGSNPAPDWRQGYGYQFWRCRHNGYRGDGAFGQYCIVMPDQEAVLAITGGLPDMQVVLNAVWDNLLPGMQSVALPADESSASQLAQTLTGLRLTPPPAAPAPGTAARVSGQTYRFGKNAETLHSLSFDFQANTLNYRLLGGGPRRGSHTLHFGQGAWLEDIASLGAPAPMPVAASGTWTTADTFTLTLCYCETPFTLTITCHFEAGKVALDFKSNVAFGPTEQPRIVGLAA
jgi:hypothetical protein